MSDKTTEFENAVMARRPRVATRKNVVLVTGGRHYADRARVFEKLDQLHAERPIELLVHGACHLGGADQLAQEWADDRGIPAKGYPVSHAVDGPWPGAGPARNFRMLVEAQPTLGVAFPGDRGTRNMVRVLRTAGVPVWEFHR